MAKDVINRITDKNKHPWVIASDVMPEEPGLEVLPPLRSRAFVGISADAVRKAYAHLFGPFRIVTVLIDDGTHIEPKSIEAMISLLHQKGIIDDDPSPEQLLGVVSRLVPEELKIRFATVDMFEKAVDEFYDNSRLGANLMETDDGMSLITSRAAIQILQERDDIEFTIVDVRDAAAVVSQTSGSEGDFSEFREVLRTASKADIDLPHPNILFGPTKRDG